MSTRTFKSIRDFIRHGVNIEVRCKCGHWSVLDARMVNRKFDANKWYTGLNDGYSMGAPETRFRCTRCRKKQVVRIGPGER